MRFAPHDESRMSLGEPVTFSVAARDPAGPGHRQQELVESCFVRPDLTAGLE